MLVADDKGGGMLPRSQKHRFAVLVWLSILAAFTACTSVEARYNFENSTLGWEPETHEDTKACIQTLQSDENAKEGDYSLKLVMNLVGGDPYKSKGEAWIDIRNFPPTPDTTVPVDMTNRTLTVWVYAPAGSLGDKNRPNGLQIFVKDVNFRSNYGSWTNITEDKWIQLSLVVSHAATSDGYMDQGFDPAQIIIVGVKMGAGGGSSATFEGPIYVDAVNW